jgi:hypothetical protein
MVQYEAEGGKPWLVHAHAATSSAAVTEPRAPAAAAAAAAPFRPDAKRTRDAKALPAAAQRFNGGRVVLAAVAVDGINQVRGGEQGRRPRREVQGGQLAAAAAWRRGTAGVHDFMPINDGAMSTPRLSKSMC